MTSSALWHCLLRNQWFPHPHIPLSFNLMPKEFANDRIIYFDSLNTVQKQEAWSQTIERSLAESTAQFLFMPTKPGQQCINIPLRKFGEPYYIMERGSIEQKMQMLLASMQRSATDSFNIKQLEQVGDRERERVYEYILSLIGYNFHTIYH